MPLLVNEVATSSLLRTLAEDPLVLVWWATEVECASAIARSEREGGLSEGATLESLARLRTLALVWHEVQPTDAVRQTADRLLQVHPLGAVNSLQLAAALAAAEGNPRSLELVSLDERLVTAARREGLQIMELPPGRPPANPGQIP